MIYMLDVFEFKTSCTIGSLQKWNWTAHWALSLHNVDRSAGTDIFILQLIFGWTNPTPLLFQVTLGGQMEICGSEFKSRIWNMLCL